LQADQPKLHLRPPTCCRPGTAGTDTPPAALGQRSGGFGAVGLQPAVDQRNDLIDHVGPHAVLCRNGLHQPVHPLDMGRAGSQGPRRRGWGNEGVDNLIILIALRDHRRVRSDQLQTAFTPRQPSLYR
jgi:hypothetical protein